MMASSLFYIAWLALSITRGVQSQIPGPANTTNPCVTTRGVEFDNCLELAGVDVFWNINATFLEMTFESTDGEWAAVGFSNAFGMITSDVVFGCIDGIQADAAGADYRLSSRTLPGVQQMGNQNLAAYVVTRENGICTVAFTRPIMPGGDVQSLAVQTNLIAARGGSVLARHPTGPMARNVRQLDLNDPLQNEITPPVAAVVPPVGAAPSLHTQVTIVATVVLGFVRML